MKNIETIYLVDDDDVFQFLTKKVIEESNLVSKIKIFNNGQEAIEDITDKYMKGSQLPEIILLDLSMPVMDGWEFLEEFSKIENNHSIMIYVISSSISPKDVEKANSYSSVRDYIIKPITKVKFIELLNNIEKQ